jgi:hypothetical protein
VNGVPHASAGPAFFHSFGISHAPNHSSGYTLSLGLQKDSGEQRIMGLLTLPSDLENPTSDLRKQYRVAVLPHLRLGPRREPSPSCLSKRFIGYFWVSTDRLGRSGLGLEAQREAVLRYLAGVAGKLEGEFIEIESGRRNDRPQLAAAIAAAKKARATLIIAKLDRLARNVHFISGLMESGVDFVAADNTHANKLMMHMLAAFAEHEREQISQRTKGCRRAITRAR